MVLCRFRGSKVPGSGLKRKPATFEPGTSNGLNKKIYTIYNELSKGQSGGCRYFYQAGQTLSGNKKKANASGYLSFQGGVCQVTRYARNLTYGLLQMEGYHVGQVFPRSVKKQSAVHDVCALEKVGSYH